MSRLRSIEFTVKEVLGEQTENRTLKDTLWIVEGIEVRDVF